MVVSRARNAMVLGVLGAVGVVGSLASSAACSSTDPPATVVEEEREDAADAARPTIEAGADADADASTCSPATPPGPPRFVPSRPWRRDACTPAQVTGYVRACLESAGSVCAAFAKQNPTCFACAETDETAAEWGPIVIFAHGSYFEENFAGCIANALGDLSQTGCGGARAQFEECRRESCRGCLPIDTQEAYDSFAACGQKKELAKTCATSIAQVDVACAGHLAPTPADPVYPCLGVGLDARAYFEQYVSLFCTAAPDAGDASTD